jgi:hypothetical protein
VIAAILVDPLFASRPVALPVLARLWRGKDTASRSELALAMVKDLKRCGRTGPAIADAAYHHPQVAGLPAGITWTTRLAANATLHGLPPARTGKRGRPRKKGNPLGTLTHESQFSQNPSTSVPMHTPYAHGCSGRHRADIRENGVDRLNKLLSRSLPGKEDHVEFGRLVRRQLRRSLKDFRIAADHSPPTPRDVPQPDLIASTFGNFTAAVKLGGSVDRIAKLTQHSEDAAPRDVLVEVELRRRGPRGRVRRL